MFERLREQSAASISPLLGSSDHYYWFTAMLAGRGIQTATCRLIAFCVTALGFVPVVLMASPGGPRGLEARVTAIVVAACCVLQAVFWMRDRWPSRWLSLVCAVGGTVAVAVSTLIVSDPVVGVLGATSFVLPTVYVVCFHTPRLLIVTWSVTLATLAVLFWRLVSTDPAFAICAVFVIALLNGFVAFACRMAISLIQPDTHHGDIEQLTGLLHRDAFYRSVATLLASRSRSDDQYLVVLAVNIDSFSLLLGLSGHRGGNRARVAVGQALRETVRHNAVVAHVSDDDFLIADTFTTSDASPLVERLRGAIATTPQRLTASIGVVCTPLPPLASEPPDEVLDRLIAIATQAIEQARMAGGNQVRYVLRKNLDEDDDGSDDWPDEDKTA